MFMFAGLLFNFFNFCFNIFFWNDSKLVKPLSLDLEPALSEPVTLSSSSSESESVMILGASHSVFFLGINGDCLALESIEVFFFLLIKGELKNVLKSKAILNYSYLAG